MKSELLCTDDIIAWCRRHGHKEKGLGKFNSFGWKRFNGFSRSKFVELLGVTAKTYQEWINRKEKIPKRFIPVMSRFIRDWENGLIDFRPVGNYRKRQLVRLEKPEPPPPRLKVTLGLKPRLNFVARLPPAGFLDKAVHRK